MARRSTRAALILTMLVASVAVAQEIDDDLRNKARRRIEALRPALVTTTSIGFEKRTVVVAGESSNVNAVANFVENVKSDPLFAEPAVRFVRARPDASPTVYEFEFTVAVQPDQ